jgi:aspartyl-tRNA(Asn)/glutamyl-tRNA(Gln) amidotransferase subunit C
MCDTKRLLAPLAQLRLWGVDITKLLRLARIEIPQQEEALIEKRLHDILAAFENLQKVSLEGVEPIYNLTQENFMREDTPVPAIDREALLKNAPDVFDGAYRVGRVVKSE